MVTHLLCATEVPVQFFQSVVAIELGVIGALLFNINFFDRRKADRDVRLPNPWLSLGLAIILGSTLFGSLWAIAHRAGTGAAIAVTVGLAISIVPILLSVLPSLTRDALSRRRASGYRVTLLALVVYVLAVAILVVALHD